MNKIFVLLTMFTAPRAFADCAAYCVRPASRSGMVQVVLLNSGRTQQDAANDLRTQCEDLRGQIAEVVDPAALNDGYGVHLVPAEFVRIIESAACY